MRSVEASAKTRKEAIQKALDQLGAELHEVEIKILDEGSRGILGLGARDVTVLVTKEEEEAPEPQEAPKRKRGGRRPQKDRKPREGEPRGERPKEGQKENGQGQKGREKRKPRQGARAEGGRSGERQGDKDSGGGRRKGGGRKPSDSRRQSAGPRQERKRPERRRDEDSPRPSRPRKRDTDRTVDPQKAEQTGNAAAALLQEMIAKMGMDATVTSALNEDKDIVLTVNTEDSAILIGRKGRNLSAMQFLINRMVLSPEDGDDAERIIVDVEGYLDRRKTGLEELAQRMAERAKETGRSVRINKVLSPQERRIVHLALEGDEDVETYSLGSAMHRRVVIVPKGADKDDIDDSEPDEEDEYRDEEERESSGNGGEPRRASEPAATSGETSNAEPKPSGRRGARGRRGGKPVRPKMPYKIDVAAAREQANRDDDE